MIGGAAYFWQQVLGFFAGLSYKLGYEAARLEKAEQLRRGGLTREAPWRRPCVADAVSGTPVSAYARTAPMSSGWLSSALTSPPGYAAAVSRSARRAVLPRPGAG